MTLLLTVLSFLLLAWSIQKCRKGDFRRDIVGWSSLAGAFLGWCGFLYGLNRLI